MAIKSPINPPYKPSHPLKGGVGLGGFMDTFFRRVLGGFWEGLGLLPFERFFKSEEKDGEVR